MRWQERALCREVSPAIFFPEGSSGESNRQVRAALAVCRRCPVRPECADYALRHLEGHGVWGGMTVTQRERVLGRSLGPRTRRPAGAPL